MSGRTNKISIATVSVPTVELAIDKHMVTSRLAIPYFNAL